MTTLDKQECYVLQVMGGKEWEVREKLRTDGYEAYVPMQAKLERRNGDWKEITGIMMPGYVFVITEMTVGHYYSITRIPGVVTILKKEDQPIPLSTDEMIQLQWMLSTEVLKPSVLKKESEGRYKLIGGPLMGYDIDILSVTPRNRRFTVLIYFGGKTHEVTLSAYYVGVTG